MMILLLLDKETTWDVTANGGTGGPCKPGKSNMFSHAGYNSEAADGHFPQHLRKLADSLVEGIPHHHAKDWDASETTRTWRQQRFEAAIAAGLRITPRLYARGSALLRVPDGSVVQVALFDGAYKLRTAPLTQLPHNRTTVW